MSWYKLIFKQNQPIHIGSAKWGVVKETDIFISGQTMWGALTNRYILENKVKENQLNDINKIFETISNFFPSFDGESVLEPHYEDGEFHLGDFSESEFKAYFIDTLVQTAVEPNSRKAKDETLHEIDYILPKPKNEFQNNPELKDFKDALYWIGIVNIENYEQYESFFENGLKIYVGADKRYGYGELELVKVEDLHDKDFWWIDEDETNFKIKTDKNSPYFIETLPDLEFEGEYLLLTELDFSQNIPIVKEAGFFISAGSKLTKITNETDKNLILKKGKLISKIL